MSPSRMQNCATDYASLPMLAGGSAIAGYSCCCASKAINTTVTEEI